MPHMTSNSKGKNCDFIEVESESNQHEKNTEISEL